MKYLVAAAVLAVGVSVSARQSLTVSPSSATIDVGQTVQLTVTGANGAPTFTSSAPGIASVNATGLVTGGSAGTAVITAKKGKKTGTSTITVNAVDPPDPPDDCGEDSSHWHPSVVNGCQTGHEHGDAPPLWVEQSGQMPHFNHAGGTPNENVLKHTSFKGFNFTHPNGVEVYVTAHNDTHPNGQQTRFHSVQVWARDPDGGVSYWAQWMDFGENDQTGSSIRPAETCGYFNRPVIAVNFPQCQLVMENWYARPIHAWGWDLGINTQPSYFGGPEVGTYSSGQLGDAATWLPTGLLNNSRRIELAFYRSRAVDSLQANGLDIGQTFYGTQFGQLVSGPSDPICGSPVTIGGRTYTTVCLQQHIAVTMRDFSFPGNDYANTWACPGCRLPN